MKITDKELLAICNLSNLRMEFADIASKRDREGKILSNHTIYSLLEKEIESIKNDVNNKEASRAFSRKRENRDGNGPAVEEAIYNSLDDLKYKSGIVYEYYEKKNPEFYSKYLFLNF